jgi:hypothetical protein
MAAGWLAKFTERRLIYSIQYHADQELDMLRKYRGDLLSFDGASIQFQRKSNSGRLNGRRSRCAHGVLSTTVDDTLLRSRLQAWTDRVKEDWGLHSASSRGA